MIATIPPYLLMTDKTVGANIIRFIKQCGYRYHLDPLKPASIKVDHMSMEFSQTKLFLAQKDMVIEIIQ